MADTAIPSGHRSKHRRETVDFRLILAVSFPFFLVAAVLTRVLPGRRRPAGVRRRSLLVEARALADTYIPFAFMG